jgi:hypothetical protein
LLATNYVLVNNLISAISHIKIASFHSSKRKIKFKNASMENLPRASVGPVFETLPKCLIIVGHFGKDLHL